MASTAAEQKANWGVWAFDIGELALVLKDEESAPFSIPLRKVTSSACMLDFIFEVRSKKWATNEVVGDLITAFQELFDPHITLCGGGVDKKLDPVVHFDTRRPS
jgi:hypothetical protein